jgi:hypothetical protein
MAKRQSTRVRSELQSFRRKITPEWVRKHPREFRVLTLRCLKRMVDSTRRSLSQLERQYNREVAELRAFECRRAA